MNRSDSIAAGTRPAALQERGPLSPREAGFKNARTKLSALLFVDCEPPNPLQ